MSLLSLKILYSYINIQENWNELRRCFNLDERFKGISLFLNTVKNKLYIIQITLLSYYLILSPIYFYLNKSLIQ
jgi:hypothetical protein